MKNIVVPILVILVSFNSFSQKECSSLKSNHVFLKSNTLSIDLIKETEKYDVHFYNLDLSLTNLNTLISGTVEFHATTTQPLDSILFELFNTLTITEIRLNGLPTNFKRKDSYVKVVANLNANNSFILSIDYNGLPPTNATNPMGGAGLTSKIETNYNTQVTASLSEPFSAYEWWPCKQSLTDKADSCEIKITVPSNCKAGSNGILKNTIDLGNGKTRYEWKHNHPIVYYLISVAVAEYVDYSIYTKPIGSAGPVLIQNYIYNDPKCLTDNKSNIDATADYIELFSDLFSLYPFHNEKYGHCLAPIGGGMEHQTMTTQSNFNKNLTAHELGHQWFGNNVTCGSWADIWVNEGFATYAQYLMLENLHPNERKYQMEEYHSKVLEDIIGRVYINKDTLNPNRIFDYRLTYAKGASIIHTFRFIMNNDSLFFKALQNYQNQFRGKTATGLDVKKCFEDVSGIDFTNAFNEWYFGEGYPSYKIKWNIINNDLSLEIDQYPSYLYTTPKFTNPLEISFYRKNQSDTTIRFNINELQNYYLLPNIGKVTDVKQIDPNNWIVNKNDTIIYEPWFEVFPPNYSSEENLIKISPNPTSGLVNIIAKSPGLHHLILNDSKGKIIYENDFIKDIDLDISKMAAGIYFAFIKSEYGITQCRKIVKD